MSRIAVTSGEQCTKLTVLFSSGGGKHIWAVRNGRYYTVRFVVAAAVNCEADTTQL